MTPKEWNRLSYESKKAVITDLGGYYLEHNARCSWSKLTEHVQKLLSQINVERYLYV